MTLKVHHLRLSQSERIVWLLEELNIPYELICYDRDPKTILAPSSLKAVHPAGTAPVMEDDPSPVTGGKVMLAESGAIVEYIIHVHGGGRLALTPKDKEYAEYLNWFHFVNGTLQPALGRIMTTKRLGAAEDNPAVQFLQKKVNGSLEMMEERLKNTGKYLGGQDVTAADIMVIFTLTTMRGFCPIDLSGYDNILAYLKRVADREAYQRALKKGDPGLEPLIQAKVDHHDIWKKVNG